MKSLLGFKNATVASIVLNQAFWLLAVLEYRKALKEANSRITEANEQYVKLHNMSMYMAHLIDRDEDMEFTEFDMIALTELGLLRNEESQC